MTNETPMECRSCGHWWAWDKRTVTPTHGDCQHPKLKGKLNGCPADFGCLFHDALLTRAGRDGEGT